MTRGRVNLAHLITTQAANLLADRLAALGLAEVLAIRACPEQAHRLSVRDCQRIHLKHIAAEVARWRMVGSVQADGFGVVVDGDIDMAADGLLDTGGGSTATGKQIHDQLGVDGQHELRGKHRAPESKKPAQWRA